MPSVIQPAEFFVVGGPVLPGRSCYVERTADRRIDAALRAKRLCCVLGPRAIGKSSLLERAARTQRDAGALVATVDLRRIAEQLGNQTADRWLRRVAERVAAELELRVDVGTWWNAHDAIAENRLVEFFWKVVLTNTAAPIVVLFDDIDAALELPFAAELLDAIGECYERRSREPDFARLNFVLAGCVSQRELAEESPDSAFAEAEVVVPDDFNAAQAYRLAVAFGGDRELAQALMDRICAWTGGHPYLTQRVARGVARKGGRLEDVERIVREQLLAPGAADKDPLLGHVRASLGEPSRPARRATALLQRLAAGAKVAQPADAAVWEQLWLSGTVRLDEQRKLRIRNRVFKELVAAGWLKQQTSGLRFVATAAVLLLALAAGAYWYTQRLPVADIATLADVTSELEAAEEAYRRLRGLPGFAERADALWLAALERESRAATALPAVLAADTRLRELPGREAAADRLLSEFWLRSARRQAHAEQREPAILLAQRAAAVPSPDPAAATYLAELVGDDYARLERSLRLADAPEYWHMLFADASLVSIDAQQQASRTPFGAAAGAGALGTAPLRLTALEHSALTRELTVDVEGTAGEFELSVMVQHAAGAELLVTLAAPSGAEAALTVPRSDGVLVETFAFQAAPGSALAQLADEGVQGVWRLTVVDRVAGNTGVFGGWGLRFGDDVRRDDLPELLAIPDPRRVEAVAVQAVADRAIAWPTAAGVIGTVALWNLTTGRLEHDFTLPSAPRTVSFDAAGARLLAATDRVLMLWNVADGVLIARVATQTEFVLPPVFSADGGYVAIAERVDGANPLYSVLRSADASLVASIEGPADAQGWELGPGGRYVALQGPETVLRVLETRRGAELRRLTHEHAVQRLLHAGDGARLVTVDRTGAIAAWSLAVAGPNVGRLLGRTVTAASVSASDDGRRLAFTREDGAVAVMDAVAGAEVYRLRVPRSLPHTSTQLSEDGMQLVTQSGAMLKLWSLPSTPVVPRAAPAVAVPSALALDRTSDLIGVGLATGQLQVTPVAAAGSGSSLAFFGHRGRITAAALNGGRGLAATGGNDGVVRVWDVASGAPTGIMMQPPDAPVASVGLSADGRYVASAAGRLARIAAVEDGRVVAEVQADGAVSALAFAPDSASIGIGDATGAVRILAVPAGRERATARLGSGATSLAFTPDGSRLAAADAGGAITLLDSVGGDVESMVRHWTQPIRWLEFSPDASTLLAATDAWLHTLDATTPALAPVESRLVVWPASNTTLTAISATSVGIAGVAADGSLTSSVLDLAAPSGGASNPAALVARDWQTAFALRLNDNGEPVPFDP